MSDNRITELAELTAVADEDYMYVVDRSDTSDSAQGSSRFAQVKNVSGWGETSAETSASATISNYKYYPGDIRRYGASVSTADNTTAIQDAINVAMHGDGRVYVPNSTGARYRHASTLYFYYDASNNPNAPSGARRDGRLILGGDGKMTNNQWLNSEYGGSTLEYTGSTGNGFDFYDSSGAESRELVVRDINLIGTTSDPLVQIKYVPTVLWNNVYIGNQGTGGGVDSEDCWNSLFIKCSFNGDGSSGSAFAYDAVEAGGGLHNFISCSFSNASIGCDWGSAYAARSAFNKNVKFDSCEFGSNATGFRGRHGLSSALFLNSWFEANTTVGCILTDQAGYYSTTASNFDEIRFLGCRFAYSDAGANAIELGDDTTTSTTDSIGHVSVEKCTFIGNTTGDAIRRHNDSANGRLIIDRVTMANAGQFIVVDDEAQGGDIIIRHFDGDDKTPQNWVETTAGANRPYLAAEFEQFIYELVDSATAYDFSGYSRMPSVIAVRPSGANGVTITPPSSPDEDHTFKIVKYDGTTAFTFEGHVTTGDGNNINGSTSDFTDTTAWKILNGAWDDTRGWVLS